MKISKPDMSNIWAEGGSVAVVPSEKISQGWVVEIPPCEQMNFAQNRQDSGIAYILQQGIPEWGSSTEFQATSYVQHDGTVYKGLGVNTNKQPDLFPDFWEVAFDTAGSAQAVQDQLDAIEADADPFDQYLLEVDAAKYGIKSELEALTAVNLNIISDGVYQFDNTCTNRPFESGKIVQNTSGSVKYQYAESLTQGIATRTSTSGVFTDWKYAVTNSEPSSYGTLQSQITALANLLENNKIKVGDMFLTTNDFLAPSEVTTHLGYGTWARHGEGRALVGKSDQPLDPAWTKVQNSGFGNYTHSLTSEQLAPHVHPRNPENVNEYVNTGTDGGLAGRYEAGQTFIRILGTTGTSGEGEPFNIVQPSIVIGIWRRTS